MQYPTRNDETFFNRLKSELDLEWFKNRVSADIAQVELPFCGFIMSMASNIITADLTYENGDKLRVVVKRIRLNELPEKRCYKTFILSVDREVDFYAKLPQEIRRLFPDLLWTAKPAENQWDLIFKDVTKDGFFQRGDYDEAQMKAVLRALAHFHAHFWGKVPNEERGAFWVLDRRLLERPDEVENADETWKKLLKRIPEIDAKTLDLVTLLALKARILDDFVANNCYTRIHGDAKAWNVFVNGDEKALLIDMQSTGKGHPLQDVAYALTTSLEAQELNQMDSYVDYYINCLRSFKIELPEDFKSHFDLIWLDYCRVIVTGLWRTLSPEQIEQYKDKIGPSMINKSMKHVNFILKRLESLKPTLESLSE